MSTLFGYKIDPRVGKDSQGVEFDWIAKDSTYSSSLLKAMSTGDVDLSSHCTETNQLSLSACVGNATGDSIEMLNDIIGLPKVQVSRLQIYSCSRLLQDDDGDGQNDLNQDAGTHIRLAFDVLSRFGVCEESVWPYDVSKVFVVPSMKAMRQAVGHKIHSYYRIKATGSDRLDEIVSALRAGHPVVFGTLISSAFQAVIDGTPIGPPTNGVTIGGHCMIVVGYINGSFLVKNSWGKTWGAGGFCFMRPEYLSWDQTTDIWVPTLGTSFA